MSANGLGGGWPSALADTHHVMVRTQRFVEIPPPIEERVSETMVARFREAVSVSNNVHDRLNQTMHDAHLRQRATHSAIDAVRPGSVTFGLLVAMLLAMVAQRFVVRRETRRILREHGTSCHEPKAAVCTKTD